VIKDIITYRNDPFHAGLSWRPRSGNGRLGWIAERQLWVALALQTDIRRRSLRPVPPLRWKLGTTK
jgi:hypothetical protein